QPGCLDDRVTGRIQSRRGGRLVDSGTVDHDAVSDRCPSDNAVAGIEHPDLHADAALIVDDLRQSRVVVHLKAVDNDDPSNVDAALNRLALGFNVAPAEIVVPQSTDIADPAGVDGGQAGRIDA